MHLFRPLSRGVVAGTATAIVLAGGGAVVAVSHLRSHNGASTVGTSTAASTTHPVVDVQRNARGRVPWNHELVLVAHDGSFRSVLVADRRGDVIDGALSSDHTRWTSSTTLIPKTRYDARLVLANGTGELQRNVHFRSTDTKKHLTALLSPGDGDVVGVGSPVIVHLSRPVSVSERAAIEKRLAVSTTPEVVGAWHWLSDQELHWRPPTYWKPGTSVTVSADLDTLPLGGGVWGVGSHNVHFKIGASHISRVDVARHEMYVYQGGKLIRTMPISAGRDQYPTKNGVHITFEKSQVVTMDSATVGIPRSSPDGYYEKVYWDVRISYGGAFVHAAPWSVAEQGISNVSHGCVNLSVSNAIWFYNWAQRGDVVDVYNSAAAPDTADPGMADWNMSWKQWVKGDAAPTTSARLAHEPMPRSAEPPAPGSSTHSSSGSSSTYSATPTPSRTPSHKPSPRPSSSPSPSHKPHHH
jgi:lipoprotein-anchoring transpeptidase ErfK/SrfK